MLRILVILVGAACAASTVACATVAPYEREHLAKTSMDTKREGGETAFRAHLHESREGSTGGYGTGGGGGCGCN